MTFEPVNVLTGRRTGVIAQALLEKYQKVELVRGELERERTRLQQAIDQVGTKIDAVVAELNDLEEALKSEGVTPQTVSLKTVASEQAVWERKRQQWWTAQGLKGMGSYPYETGPQKQQVVATVREMLKAFGSMHVRDLHRMLRTTMTDVPSVQRLSQILSEAQEFEANRSKGWSLKGEGLDLGGSSPSVSKTTPSDEDEL